MKRLFTLLLLTQLTACMSFSDRSFRPTRNAILAQAPNIRLEKEFALSVGNSLLSFIDVVAMDDADISDLDNIQLAVYNVEGNEPQLNFDAIDFTQTLRSRGNNLHWETIIKVRDPEEQVWVLVGMNLKRNTLEAVSVFVLERNELVLINVDGDLNRMIEFAMRPASGRRSEGRAG